MESPIDEELQGRNFKDNHCWPDVVFSKINRNTGCFFEIKYFNGTKASPGRRVYGN